MITGMGIFIQSGYGSNMGIAAPTLEKMMKYEIWMEQADKMGNQTSNPHYYP
jgi:hypothetical protein